MGGASPFISARTCSTGSPSALAFASADLLRRLSGISVMTNSS
jgi:hypothetical protein